MDKITIDKAALCLLDQVGYMRRFYELLQTGLSQRECYEQVEREHLAAFDRHKYSTFESFKAVKKRFMCKYRPKIK